jgi:DNA-binding NarL/FixJ family response regulator
MTGGGDRVFIVDDHPVFRFGLTALLRAQGLNPCGEAEDARGALAALGEARAHLLIVDISLAGGSGGLALIREVKARWPSLPVVALSMHDEMLFAARALAAGAIGYLRKNMEQDYLVEGIRRALRGELVIGAGVTSVLLRRAVKQSRGGAVPAADGGARGSPVALLSDRELEIFELLGQGMATRDVADVLHISVKTVETHQGHLKAKLGLRNASELIRAAVSWVANPDADLACPR